MPLRPAAARPLGLALGIAADAVFGDPQRWHPVAGYGRVASVLERRVYRDSRARGVVYTAVAVGLPLALAGLVERRVRCRPVVAVAVTAVTTWAVLGGESLAREGSAMAAALAGSADGGSTGATDLAAARARLRNLCGRDPDRLDASALARATVESLAENTSDAVVGPLLWGAIGGLPGLVGHRAVNTLDAMVGYPSPRYRLFGWASARLDDLANLAPARITGLVMVAVAPVVGGSRRRAWRVLRRDGGRHPSPNAGRPEAAAAGALGVRLGGTNAYAGRVDERPGIGEGASPEPQDVVRAVRLVRVTGAAVGVLAVLVGWVRERSRRRP